MTTRPTPACHAIQELLGVSVLGIAEPAEQEAVMSHVATCASCAATMAELAAMPTWLGRLDASEAAAGLPEPRPELLRRIIAETRAVEARHRNRTRLLVSGAGLAAASLFALVLFMWPGGDHGSSTGDPASPGVATATNAGTGVHGVFELTGASTGTGVKVQLDGVHPGLHCRLVAVSTSGQREVAASWAVRYDGRADFTGHTSLPPDEIASLLVVTTDGDTLLHVPGSDLSS
jgi:putative zinc finger protein